jgi:hypothetical protein
MGASVAWSTILSHAGSSARRAMAIERTLFEKTVPS